jgi:hypothetical protein
MKTCTTCKQEKPLDQFAKRKVCKDGFSGQCKICQKQKIYEWRKNNKDKVLAIKRRYYSSEKGKAQKKKDDAAYIASGKRAVVESFRSKKPLSEARKKAKQKYSKANNEYFAANRARRRSLEKGLSEFDQFVLFEAFSLARLRKNMLGTNWHVDHIRPVSKGGTSEAYNLQVVPAKWNQSKGTKEKLFFATTLGGQDA